MDAYQRGYRCGVLDAMRVAHNRAAKRGSQGIALDPFIAECREILLGEEVPPKRESEYYEQWG